MDRDTSRYEAGSDRSSLSPPAPVLERGGVRLELSSGEVFVDGRPVAFSTPQFRLLECLLRRAGRIVSQEELMEVAGCDRPDGIPKLYRLVNRVRDKLGHR